jgi:hypothetical protein
MAHDRSLTDDEVRHLRLAAQALHRPGRRSAAELVRHLAGVQAQVPSAAALGLGTRSSSLTAAAVDSARLEDRSIVLCWAMRGTLHLVAAEDHGWMVPLTVEPGRANAYRRLKQEGVPPAQPERAVRLIERMLEREGPLSRAEIGERLQRDGLRTAGQAMAHLLWLAAAAATICHGPETGGKQCFVLARDWLGEPGAVGRDAALAELAIRYLAAHGPARACRPRLLVRSPSDRCESGLELNPRPPQGGGDQGRTAVDAALLGAAGRAGAGPAAARLR